MSGRLRAFSFRSYLNHHIILVCNGCRTERTLWPDVPLYGADELIEWMKTKPTQCPCGAGTCDVKAHLLNPEVLT